MQVAGAIMRRILVDMESSVDIITWDCLKKLKYSGRQIVLLVHPILGFRRQEVNPTGIIHLPLRFGDKTKVRTLEKNFLVVDVPTTYNVILGRSILHKEYRRQWRANGLERRTTKCKQKHPKALHVGIFAMVATPGSLNLIALLAMSCDLAVHKHNLLVAQAIFIYGRRNELHQCVLQSPINSFKPINSTASTPTLSEQSSNFTTPIGTVKLTLLLKFRVYKISHLVAIMKFKAFREGV
ncbi:hypothetical protein Cgig2_001680 [Carnegiea gigantea]|uniref:Uncharacterized protein n=1 Tax=Carnegiea gigantea TaxID=171969 RepID=A0A9Q1JT69_9CARY|nr:hypothetical protein Cgig2_001680 [Carnegiea gigantea]